MYNKALQHEATKLRALQCNRCVYIEINEPVLALHANASNSNTKCMHLVHCSANLTPWRPELLFRRGRVDDPPPLSPLPPPPPSPVTTPTPTNPTLLPQTSPEEGPGGPKVCNFHKRSFPCKGSQLGGRKAQVTNFAGDCPSPPDYAYAHEDGSSY